MSIPVDGRAEKDFEILKGMGETLYRLEYAIIDPNGAAATTRPDTVTIGEPLRFMPEETNGSNAVYVCNDATDSVVGVKWAAHTAGEDRVAGIAWNDYDDAGATGHPDANDRNQIVTLCGEFVARIAKTKFLATGNFPIGGIDIEDAAAAQIDGTTGGGTYGQYEVGRLVIVVNEDEAGRYATVPLAYDEVYGTVATPTAAELSVVRSAIGKVIKVETNHITVRFSI